MDIFIKNIAQFFTIRPASSCPSSWEQMTGDGRIRWSNRCRHLVYNPHGMTPDALVSLIWFKEGKKTSVLFQRDDGMLLTEDCAQARGQRRLAASFIGGGLLTLTFLVLWSVNMAPRLHSYTTGKANSVSSSRTYDARKSVPSATVTSLNRIAGSAEGGQGPAKSVSHAETILTRTVSVGVTSQTLAGPTPSDAPPLVPMSALPPDHPAVRIFQSATRSAPADTAFGPAGGFVLEEGDEIVPIDAL